MTSTLTFEPADDFQHLAALTLLRAGAVPTWDTSRAVVIRWANIADLEPDPLVGVAFAALLVLADLDREGTVA